MPKRGRAKGKAEPGSASSASVSSHVTYGGSRRQHQRFEYSEDSTAGFVELSPLPITNHTDSKAPFDGLEKAGPGKLKHVQLRWWYLQDAVRDMIVNLKKIHGVDNRSDVLTKAVDKTTLQRHMRMLRVFVASMLWSGVRGEQQYFERCEKAAFSTETRGHEKGSIEMKWEAVVMLFTALAIVFVAGYALGYQKSMPDTKPETSDEGTQVQVETVNKNTQSPCTYTFRHSTPRFTPLREYAQGAW